MFNPNFKKIPVCSFILIAFLFLFSCGKIIIYGPSAKQIRKNRNFNWQTEATPHFKIYYEPDSYPNQHISRLKNSNEKSYSHILSLLDVKSYDDTINIFIVDSRKKMKKILGWETNGSALPKNNVVCYVYSKKIKANGAHEIMHVISINLWGRSNIWIQEGLAVFSDDNWYGYDLHQLCKYLLVNDKLISLENLIKKFKSYNDMITYPEAGSFVKFLYEKYGLKVVKDIWKKGGRSIQKIIGKNLTTIEKEWLDILNQYDCKNVEYRI